MSASITIRHRAVLIIAVFFGLGAQSRQAISEERSSIQNRERILSEMGEIVFDGIRRHNTKHPVFHGCIDWHSAVHGHWALLRINCVTDVGDEWANHVAASFDSAGIDREAALLRDKPKFEMPYGRAWFLRLAIEYERWCAANGQNNGDALTEMANEIASSLLAYYETRVPSPASREYSNDSWAFFQLHAFLAHRKDAIKLEAVSKLIDAHFVRSTSNLSFRVDRRQPDFFSPYGNWSYLIARTRDSETLARFLAAHPISKAELRPVDPLMRRAHHFGVNWSRAWAFRALSQKVGDDQLRRQFDQAFHQHVEVGMKHHRRYAGDFGRYDHWVPQFAVYAITE